VARNRRSGASRLRAQAVRPVKGAVVSVVVIAADRTLDGQTNLDGETPGGESDFGGK
jgi:hypothetical protein